MRCVSINGIILLASTGSTAAGQFMQYGTETLAAALLFRLDPFAIVEPDEEEQRHNNGTDKGRSL